MSEERCEKCKELKKDCKCPKDPKTDTSVQDIHVKVDTGNVEAILKRLADEEAKSKKLAQDLEEAKKNNDTTAKTLEETKKKEQEYAESLKKIEEEKFNSERAILINQAKEVFKDEEQIKKLEEGLKDPKSLAATKALIDTVATAMKKGEEQHQEILKKEKEEYEKKLAEKTGGAGNIGMTPEMIAAEQAKYAKTQGYDSHQDMIRDLRAKSHSDDALVAAKARSQLDELLRKWAIAAKKNFDGKIPQTELGPKNIDEQPSLRIITKKGGEAI